MRLNQHKVPRDYRKPNCQLPSWNGIEPDGRGGSDLGAVNHDDETSSTSSEKYGRDVTTLNHCFDDIEKFIARLQHAAAASRELERRRKKSKKKNMGDGMLTMRAKPPPENEFVDIFQKFKLSFILLAKLKQHIHDPNAPELVHFLFTPLALIVDASNDTNYGPNLPSKVVSPLLTQEAVHLLVNCVTSKETELWQSLGDAWLVPKEHWKGYVDPYHPVFLDGWSPDYPVIDDREDKREVVGSGGGPGGKPLRGGEIRSPPHEAELRDVHYREREDYSSDYFEYDRQESSPTDPQRYNVYESRNYSSRNERFSREERVETQSPGDLEPGPPPPPRSDISADSIERSGGPASGGDRFERLQARWLEELHANGAKIVQVTYPRTANNDKELSVIRGEYLQVLDDSRKWWKARNYRGDIAHVPHTIVTPYQPPESADVFNAHRYPRGYYAQEERLGRGAVIPAPPPAPPAQPAPAPAEWVRKERLDFKSGSFGGSSASSSYKEDSLEKDRELQIELKNALSMMREKPRITIHRSPDVYIDMRSKPDAVQKWLKQKSFSIRICKKLEGMSGSELLKLPREDIESMCGIEEGRRLFSQILVQRNLSGYKTTRNAELNDKLAKVRQKLESADV